MKKNWKSLAATTAALTLITLGGTPANAAITNDLDDLDVEIKYGNKKVDIDYEVKSYFFGMFTRTEAKYVNTVNNETLTGSKAETKIKSLFNSVDIKSDTQEDIATKVLAQTKTDATYTKFDFEAEYTNGQSRKFKLTPSATGNGTTTNDTTIVDFDLDIKYGIKEVELDYEVKTNSIDAKIKNELTGQTYTGASAQTAIEQLLAGFDFANATQEATINYLITQLGLGTDYTKFDFEIKYANGKKVEFEVVGAPTTSSTSSSNNTSSTSSSATESTSSSSSAASVVANNENLIDLEIEIKYPANKKYDFEYEVKRNGYKAKYQNAFTGEYTTGDAARTKVLALTDGINLSTATQEQVIQHVLSKLGASEYYIEFEAEFEFTNSPKVKFEVKQVANNASTADIELAKAKEIAFNHAGTTEAAVRLKKAKADYDDGIKEYEIEFVVNGYEYDYIIDASTGRITDYDKERD